MIRPRSALVPDPPKRIEPTTATWSAGRRLYRVHGINCGPLQFNPGTDGGRGRFHPIRDASGQLIPTLYAADRIDGVLSETVFHNVMAGGVILRAQLANRFITELTLLRDISIADLTGHGLRKLGLNRSQLLECDAPHYERTARWAEAVHLADETLHGMVWVSRQFDRAKALLVFGDRLTAADFSIADESQRLDYGPGFRRVQQAASAAGITVVEG